LNDWRTMTAQKFKGNGDWIHKVETLAEHITLLSDWLKSLRTVTSQSTSLITYQFTHFDNFSICSSASALISVGLNSV
jgi:hypothetical protein